jgi:hypothetical protein
MPAEKPQYLMLMRDSLGVLNAGIRGDYLDAARQTVAYAVPSQGPASQSETASRKTGFSSMRQTSPISSLPIAGALGSGASGTGIPTAQALSQGAGHLSQAGQSIHSMVMGDQPVTTETLTASVGGVSGALASASNAAPSNKALQVTSSTAGLAATGAAIGAVGGPLGSIIGAGAGAVTGILANIFG